MRRHSSFLDCGTDRFLALCFVVCLLAAPFVRPGAGTAATVCLDPGHGSLPGSCQPNPADPGAQGLNCVKESLVNLEVALKTKAVLECQGQISVFLTRTDETCVFLDDRPASAEEGGATQFVSIHHDAFDGDTPRTCDGETRGIDITIQGTETYYATTQNPLIVPESRRLAESIQPRLVAAYGYRDRMVKTANYVVLRLASMPAALGEASFISDPAEEILLDPFSFHVDEFTHRQHIEAEAQGYHYGVRDYLNLPICFPTVSAVAEFSGRWDGSAVVLTLRLNARPLDATRLMIIRGGTPVLPGRKLFDLDLEEPANWNLALRDTLSLRRGSVATYRLVAVLSPGRERPVTSIAIEIPPTAAILQQNRPNPFNPSTTIEFSLPSESAATLRVYDVSGRNVITLYDSPKAHPGRHLATWDGRNEAGTAVASGVYFYHLTLDRSTLTKRMVLLR